MEVIFGQVSWSHLSSDRVIAPCHQVSGSSTTLSAAPENQDVVEVLKRLVAPAPALYLPLVALSVGVSLLHPLRDIPASPQISFIALLLT